MLKYWADLWATALESGEYKQGTGCLRKEPDPACDNETCCPANTTTYCCLGVLTDVVSSKMPSVGAWESGGFRSIGDAYVVNDYAPPVIQDVTGLSHHNPVLFRRSDESGVLEGLLVRAAGANDAEGLTFAEIAAHIRENYADM